MFVDSMSSYGNVIREVNAVKEECKEEVFRDSMEDSGWRQKEPPKPVSVDKVLDRRSESVFVDSMEGDAWRDREPPKPVFMGNR